MARTKISEFSSTAADNTDIDGIDIAEGCAPSGINNAIRTLMADLKDMQTGASGDTFTFASLNATTANIDGGTIDGATIGGSSAAPVSSTNLAYTGTLTGGTGVINIGSGQIYKDASGNVGIGASPNANATLNVLTALRVEGSGITDSNITIGEGRSGNGYAYIDLIGDTTYTDYGMRIIRQNSGPNTGSEVAARGTGAFTINCVDAGTMVFSTSNTERARITSNGQFLVRTTGVGTNAAMQVAAYNSTSFCLALENHQSTTFGGMGISLNNDATAIAFYKSWSGVGNITITSTSTAYNTSSDYRLKDIEGEITDSGSYIDALRPVHGSWKADGSKFIGLIAHEVQEVSQTKVVTGAKDEVDENGKPVYQGLDYSSAEIIANLIAEVQSLRKRVAQLEQGA